eukprot:s3003_g3.t1
MAFPLLWVLYTNLIGRTIADGLISTTWTLPWQSSSSFVIEPVCTNCKCTPGPPEWRGQQSLESCALTCQQEGSWFRHASGTKEDGNPGDNNCGCCLNVETLDEDTFWGINVYQVRDLNSFHYYLRTCAECSCLSSDKFFSAVRSFGDCAAFCAAQNFPHFQYETADGADGTCACCNSDTTATSVGGTSSVYAYAESKVEVAESAPESAPTGSAHHVVPYLLHVIFLPFLW